MSSGEPYVLTDLEILVLAVVVMTAALPFMPQQTLANRMCGSCCILVEVEACAGFSAPWSSRIMATKGGHILAGLADRFCAESSVLDHDDVHQPKQ